jgi:lipoprotein-releasing system ATP-binding protein
MDAVVLQTRNINKLFHDPTDIQVLKNISIAVNKGEFVSVIGKSGSGKSTLLYVLSTMDTDYSGELFLDGELMNAKSHDELSDIRNAKIGFVFQFHYLLPEFNVLMNVMLPALNLGKYPRELVKENALRHLESLGIENLAYRKSNQLSGGEKQRVAIARALINDPLIVMCDEPTGNLDKRNTEVVFEIFRGLKSKQQTLLVVTHDQDFASKTDRVIQMDDGRIVNT